MAGVTPAQLAEWQAAVGRKLVEEEILHPAPLRRYAQAIGHDGQSSLPPLAHWAFFLPSPADGEIGPDGHPKRGAFLPDVSLPRRMFAAAEMEFPAPLIMGEKARQTSEIISLSHKLGGSGDLIFAKVEKRLEQDDAIRVREVQTYVYRAAGDRISMPVPDAALPQGENWQPGEVNLFRFSAATANAHRIHYDMPYATGVEGYPALVIHGPFTAAKLAALAQRGAALSSFSFRAMAPLFLSQPVRLRKSEAGYLAIRCDGVVAMEAKAGLK